MFEQRWAARFSRRLAAPSQKADLDKRMAVVKAAWEESFGQATLVPEQSGLSSWPEGKGK
jgi:HD superfamily phosphodiesterase